MTFYAVVGVDEGDERDQCGELVLVVVLARRAAQTSS